MEKVLLVDDDPAVLETTARYLRQNGFEVCCAGTAAEGLSAASTAAFDCIVLDIDLPDFSGYEVCARLREVSRVPVVFLSGYTEEYHRINGFECGGDDYVAKPFSLRELALRVRARIQRSRGDERPTVLEYDGLSIDLGRREVSYQGAAIEFTTVEFDILAFLARHPGQVFSYAQIYDRIWHAPLLGNSHTVQVHIARVRQKLALRCPEHDYIQTVKRKGYQFERRRRT